MSIAWRTICLGRQLRGKKRAPRFGDPHRRVEVRDDGSNGRRFEQSEQGQEDEVESC